MSTAPKIRDPAEVEDHVAREFELELTANDALHALSKELMRRWADPRHGIRTEGARIVAAEIARGSTNFQAILHLARAGFGRQGLMISRSMFEGMAVAHWVAANPEAAADRFNRALAYAIHKDKELMGELDVEPPVAIDELNDEELDKAIADFGPYGDWLWTGHRNIWELVDEVEDQWDEAGREGLRLFLKVEQRSANQELHATAPALLGFMLDPETEHEGTRGTVFRLGPGPEHVAGALMATFYIYSNLLGLLIDHFELGDAAKAKLKAVTNEHQYSFAIITAADIRDVGRNDPCPCTSGKKFKHCHLGKVRSYADQLAA